jgi:hypothetical protein
MYVTEGLPLPSVVDLQPSQNDLFKGSLYCTYMFNKGNLII